MSLLAPDLRKALEILQEVVSRPTFEPKSVEKVRELMQASIRAYWDEPFEFVEDLAREKVYGNHPYGKRAMGTQESVGAITREDIVEFYKSHVSPQGARLCIVGDLNNHPLEQLLEIMAQWRGPEVPPVEFPTLVPVAAQEIVYPIARDQVVLCFAGLSVARTDPDYDKLLLFDQILTGSLLGSMSSRLFQLRERTSLFYTIGGSVVAHSDKQPGMVMIKTMVSRDAVAQAEREIKNLISTVAESITEDELMAARNAIINSMVDNFETNRQMAMTFLIIDRLKLPADYFDIRMEQFYRIGLDEVKVAAKRVMDLSRLIVFKVGKI